MAPGPTAGDGAPAAPRTRAPWRAVAVPTEHGGWGLTLEPVVLGLLVAPSAAGAAIGLAAFVAFLARTPLKAALVDRRRGRRLDRTRLAERIAAVEVAGVVLLAAAAIRWAGIAWLVPVGAAVPLVVVELWFDLRSRSRRLVPELAGAIGIGASAAAIAVAGDVPGTTALALWLVLAGRSITSITSVRRDVARLHGRAGPFGPVVAAQVVGAAVATSGAALDAGVAPATAIVAAGAVLHLVGGRRAPLPVARIGALESVLGLLVVLAAAWGVR